MAEVARELPVAIIYSKIKLEGHVTCLQIYFFFPRIEQNKL